VLCRQASACHLFRHSCDIPVKTVLVPTQNESRKYHSRRLQSSISRNGSETVVGLPAPLRRWGRNSGFCRIHRLTDVREPRPVAIKLKYFHDRSHGCSMHGLLAASCNSALQFYEEISLCWRGELCEPVLGIALRSCRGQSPQFAS